MTGQQMQLKISGMKCQGCVTGVTARLEGLDAVESASVDLDSATATVHLNQGISLDIVNQAFAGTNFRAEIPEGAESEHRNAPPAEAAVEDESVSEPQQSPPGAISLELEGMHCASCANRIEKALSGVSGVSAARVNFATERASVDPAADAAREELLPRLIKAVEEAGYGAHEAGERKSGGGEPSAQDRRRAMAAAWRRRSLIGIALTVPVSVIEMGGHMGLHQVMFPGHSWVAFVLTTLVVAITGYPFFTSATKALRHGAANMDTLIALGAGTAYIFSTVVLFAGAMGAEIAGGRVYFESAAMIIALISLGKWLEAMAKLKAGESLSSLLQLSARKARVERNGETIEIDIDDIEKGDIMLVRPGEKIPTDGIIEEGESEIDESMVTGESIPVARKPGEDVIGASVNGGGSLRVRATRVGSDTALARIIAFVEKAQESKANVQRLADRISSIFVPSVIAIALATLAVWGLGTGDWAHALITAVAVVIIACPCALGLATPTAIMVGTGLGARRGILIRDAQAIEHARDIDVVVFDKTGTLTEGKPSVSRIVVLSGQLSEDQLLALTAAAENDSEHPLGRSVVRAAQDKGLDLPKASDFRAFTGKGIRAAIEGDQIYVGTAEFLDENEITLTDELQTQRQQLEDEGNTVLLVARNQQALGMIAVRDQLKEDAPRIVSALRNDLGIDVWMITGDNERTAAAMAREAGIEEKNVLAGVKPEEKAQRIEGLQNEGRRVAMVGDGINDAPALAQAHLGIALGSGTDAAMESGAMTLMSGDIEAVLRAIKLGRATYRKILQNLFWAFIYNTILIPVAAIGLLAPGFAAAAMALSSISVVSNSLLLRRAKLDGPTG